MKMILDLAFLPEVHKEIIFNLVVENFCLDIDRIKAEGSFIEMTELLAT